MRAAVEFNKLIRYVDPPAYDERVARRGLGGELVARGIGRLDTPVLSERGRLLSYRTILRLPRRRARELVEPLSSGEPIRRTIEASVAMPHGAQVTTPAFAIFKVQGAMKRRVVAAGSE